MTRLRTGPLFVLLLLTFSHRSTAAPVLMVSIDGMKPEYVLEADRHHLRLPFLRSLVADGAYAEGVVGVWPTITYPSHTTLLTGVAPAEHGIIANLQFDPERHFADAWYWYAPQIRVPTLWHSARAAGLATASIGWPVSVDAADVDYLIPEFWRGGLGPADNPSDRLLIGALTRPAGMLATLESELGPYMMGNDTQPAGDAIKTRYALAVLAQHQPRFMTVHLSSLDEAEHEHGPFSSAANATLEGIDTMLRNLAEAARAADPATVIVVVSDHGFAPLTHKVNLFVPFIAAGLIQTVPDAAQITIGSWRAQPWLAGGMAAIMLKDPTDRVTLNEVAALLRQLQADPSLGIAAVLDRPKIASLGGFPDASFVVEFKPGFYASGDLTGATVSELPGSHGGHGFAPDFPEMRAAFFAAGNGIAKHRDLGVIDMRSIAPTVAAVLGVPLPSASAAALHVAP